MFFSLYIKYKLKNIEETEKAKRAMLLNVEGGTDKKGGMGTVVKRAFGSRFHTYHEPSGQGNRPTDDIALDRFRQRMGKQKGAAHAAGGAAARATNSGRPQALTQWPQPLAGGQLGPSCAVEDGAGRSAPR